MISGLRSSLFFERLFSIGHRCLLPIFIGDIRQTSRSRVCNPYIVYNPVTCARCINTAFAFTMGKNIEIVPSACNSFLADDNSQSDLSCLFTTIYLSPFYPSPCNSHYTLYRQVFHSSKGELAETSKTHMQYAGMYRFVPVSKGS